jgi:hypothetical protein
VSAKYHVTDGRLSTVRGPEHALFEFPYASSHPPAPSQALSPPRPHLRLPTHSFVFHFNQHVCAHVPLTHVLGA